MARSWRPAFPALGLLILCLGLGAGCMADHPEPGTHTADPWQASREQMVKHQIEARGVRNREVLQALRMVPRHAFVPAAEQTYAYHDSALPIGHGQTISQPYIVGVMTELLEPRSGQKILEIGTGSGYQAAVLAQTGALVYTIEIVEPLAREAQATLAGLGYAGRVHVRAGDGFAGWPEAAPFDSIIVTCAVSQVPQPLLDQLKPGGCLVLPLGETLDYQTLTRITKNAQGELTYQNVLGVVFVPMTGPHGFNRP
ncbi:MAG: protein-L-isoaspartate(D-aspartate) O-methyltransferase [candidate division FCPU426 bacterium]